MEDARFYTHNGIDIKRIIGSFIQNFVSGTQQGGSTITQQLIKNTVLSNELSYKRKIQEAYLAMQLETKYTKLQILEYYLNTIYLGENYYGVQVAAQGYFGKELSELTLRECAMLAGLTNNPYYYNPRRNFYTRTSDTTDYKAITNNRTDYVLRCMYENEFITPSSSIRRRWTPPPRMCWKPPPPRATACTSTPIMWNMPCRTSWTASLSSTAWRIPAKTAARWKASCAPAATM